MTDAKQALEVGMALQRLLDVAHSAARGPDHIGPTQHAADMNRLRHVLDQDGSALSEAASLLSSLAEENERLRGAVRDACDLLSELVAIVRGECPSLLNEDSGGYGDLAFRIEATLTTHPAQPEGEGHE